MRVRRDVAEVSEAPVGLPSIQSGLGADPEVAVAIERKGIDAVIGQRRGIARIVALVLDVSRYGVQYIETRIARADPNPTAPVHQYRVRGVARQRFSICRIMTVDRERIAVPIPASDARILDHDP